MVTMTNNNMMSSLAFVGTKQSKFGSQYPNSFSLQHYQIVAVIIPFFQWRNWGSKWLNYLSSLTCLENPKWVTIPLFGATESTRTSLQPSFDQHREGARMNPRPCLESWSHVTGKSLEDFSTETKYDSFKLCSQLCVYFETKEVPGTFLLHSRRQNPFHSFVPCAWQPFIYSRAHLGVRLPISDRMLQLGLAPQGLMSLLQCPFLDPVHICYSASFKLCLCISVFCVEPGEDVVLMLCMHMVARGWLWVSSSIILHLVFWNRVFWNRVSH